MRWVHLAVTLAMVLAPTGAVMGAHLHEGGKAVEQHTTFVEIVANQEGERAPGFAAIAGLVSCRPTSTIDNAVLWFDDQVLFRHGRQGPDASCLPERNVTHVWATEDEAPDPRGNPSLEATGRAFEFTDPNQRHWIVREYRYHVVHAVREEETTVTVGDLTTGVSAGTEVERVPFYAWVVRLKSPTMDPTIVDFYNFVTVVDFEKLQLGPDGETQHDGEPGGTRDGNSHNASRSSEEHRFPHEHDTAEIELWVGGAPEPQDGSAPEDRTRITVLTPEEVEAPEGSVGPLRVEDR